jgi:antirestriction protein ArdC
MAAPSSMPANSPPPRRGLPPASAGAGLEAGETEQAIPFLKSYTVFNVEQIEDLPAQYHAVAQPRRDPVQRVEHAEAFFAATSADIRHGGNRAYYNIGSDFVQMPPFEVFRDAESYYATLAHECTHWTRAKSRLDRDLGRKSGAMLVMRWKNWWPNWAAGSCAPIST